MKSRLREKTSTAGFEVSEFGHLDPRQDSEDPLSYQLGSGTINFTNLKRRANLLDMEGDELRKEICRWVRIQVKSIEGLKRPSSFRAVKNRLRPQLLPPDRHVPSVLECGSFGHDLRSVVAEDDQHAFRYVTPADAKRWGKSKEELLGIAVSNLERIAEKQPVHCKVEDHFGRCCTFNSTDGYASTRILLRTCCLRVAEKLGLPFFFAMPSRDFLTCWCPAKAREAQMESFQMILNMYSMFDHPLSPITYIMKPGFSFEVHAMPGAEAVRATLKQCNKLV